MRLLQDCELERFVKAFSRLIYRLNGGCTLRGLRPYNQASALRVHQAAHARCAELLQLRLQQDQVTVNAETAAASSHKRHVLGNRVRKDKSPVSIASKMQAARGACGRATWPSTAIICGPARSVAP